MPWSNQGGGWQGGGGGRGPWGQGPRGNGPSGPGGGGFGGGPNPPNLEELLRRSQDRFRQFMPGGSVSGRGILLLILVAIAIWFGTGFRSEEHTSELQSLMRNSYAVFCLKKKTKKK